MKIPAALILVISLFSCTDTDFNTSFNANDPVLKRIYYSNDTVTPLCVGCPPTISFVAEDFTYDAIGRLSTRRLTRTILGSSSSHTDTTATYTYYYAAGSSPMIIGYTDLHTGSGPANHLLTYDNQNRLISDSVTNPQVTNDKVSLFQYLPGSIVEYDRLTGPISTTIVRDTFFISGNGVVQERSLINTTYREVSHTSSAYRNPLSYINNAALLGSDYKNGTNLVIFPIYFSQNLTYDFPIQTAYRSTSPSSFSQYTAFFQITVDQLNRIISYGNTANGNKVTYFEYY